MANAASVCRAVLHSALGVWLGLWTIGGIAMGTGGILILALECYGWLYLDLWLSVTPAGVLKRLAIVVPSLPIVPMQATVDALLRLPISVVFIWCGFNIAVMAWIARKRLERRIAGSLGFLQRDCSVVLATRADR